MKVIHYPISLINDLETPICLNNLKKSFFFSLPEVISKFRKVSKPLNGLF